MADDDLIARTPPPSKRRPRRTDVVTFRVRADLLATKPPLWRRFELASDLFLDEVHEILQEAFGWTDSHLHQFGCGPTYYSPETEYYLCPFVVGEDETGIPEDEVRLDEVLVDVGDKLHYAYDFGDDWQHVLRLEAVVPRRESDSRAVCTAGRRDGPAEDCGGVYSHELIVAAIDPTHTDHPAAAQEFTRMFGRDIDPAIFDLTSFDIDEVNAALTAFDVGARDDLPDALSEVLNAIQTTAGERRMRAMISRAALPDPVLVDAEDAAAMVRPFVCLIDHVGDGIKLTAAGYLPPALVRAVFDDLRLDRLWIGKGNREDTTMPVLHLRQAAQQVGLLRKHNGRLILTAHARSLRNDPVRLWRHLAERMPLKTRDLCEEQAGLCYLIAVAAGAAHEADEFAAELLDAIGWTRGDGSPITPVSAGRAAWPTKEVLRRMCQLESSDTGLDRPEHTSKQATVFARAALKTWS